MTAAASAGSVALGIACLAAPLAAQTAPDSSRAPARPLQAVWFQRPVLTLSASPDGHHSLGGMEYERRVSRKVTLGVRVNRWERRTMVRPAYGSLAGAELGQVRGVVAEFRGRYYVRGEAMRGLFVGVGAGYARVRGPVYDASASPLAPAPDRTSAGPVVSAEVGYTWLFGDGERNHLAVTAAFGVQRYFVGGSTFGQRAMSLGPRLGVGWTF